MSKAGEGRGLGKNDIWLVNLTFRQVGRRKMDSEQQQPVCCHLRGNLLPSQTFPWPKRIEKEREGRGRKRMRPHIATLSRSVYTSQST